MNVHNIMEEVVSQRIDELYKNLEEAGVSWVSCSCENCRLDAKSYVLNRIPPKYVVSGRGVTHNATELAADNQIKIDIDALGMEAIRLISETNRPFHSLTRTECEVAKETANPVYNFPTFIGSVLDGSTFEPVENAEVSLFLKGELAAMIDKTWENPVKTYNSTHGAYSFWVRPIPTQDAQNSMRFDFTLEVSAPGYKSAVSSFSVPVESDFLPRHKINSTYSLKIRDIVIFKDDGIEEEDL